MIDFPLPAILAERLLSIRGVIFGGGPAGLQAMAGVLGLPEQTWTNYEAGVQMPASVMILFLVVTRANPTWLLNGLGDRFLPIDYPSRFAD